MCLPLLRNFFNCIICNTNHYIKKKEKKNTKNNFPPFAKTVTFRCSLTRLLGETQLAAFCATQRSGSSKHFAPLRFRNLNLLRIKRCQRNFVTYSTVTPLRRNNIYGSWFLVGVKSGKQLDCQWLRFMDLHRTLLPELHQDFVMC